MAKTYTTMQGDTFESIAWFQMGDSTMMWDLIKANRQHRNTVVFPAGVELEIPEIDTAEQAKTACPPWRKRT